MAKSASKSDYYSGAVRIVKDGVPCRVAPWFKNLTSDGKKMIGTNRIYSAPYGKYISFKREA